MQRQLLVLRVLVAAVSSAGGAPLAIGCGHGCAGPDGDVVLDEAGAVPDRTIPAMPSDTGNRFRDATIVSGDGELTYHAAVIRQRAVADCRDCGCRVCDKQLSAVAEVNGELGDIVGFVGIDRVGTGPRSEVRRALRRPLRASVRPRRQPDALGVQRFPMTLLVARNGFVFEHAGGTTAVEAGSLG